jgi:hypothetical protein
VICRVKKVAPISLSIKLGNQSRVTEFIEVAESLSILRIPVIVGAKSGLIWRPQ